MVSAQQSAQNESVTQHLTDEKRAADFTLWQENGKRLQAIFDAAPALMFVVDDANRFVFVNRAWERAFGLGRRQVAGRSIFELIPEPEASILAAQNQRLFETGAPVETETTVRVHGAERTFVTAKVALLQGERPATVFGFSVDITERKRGESRLRLVSEIASALVIHGDDVDGFMEEMCGKVAAELGGDVLLPLPAGARGCVAAAPCRLRRPRARGGARPGMARLWRRRLRHRGGHAASSWAIADVQASGDERTRLIRDLGIAAYACYASALRRHALRHAVARAAQRQAASRRRTCELMKAVCRPRPRSPLTGRRARTSWPRSTATAKNSSPSSAHELRGPLGPIMAATELLQRRRRRREGRRAGARRDRAPGREALVRLVEELFDGARVSQGKITLEARA